MRNAVHLKWLIAAFALIAAVFVASAGATYRTLSAIDQEVTNLKRNSLPGVGELSAARAELQRARLRADLLMLSTDGWGVREFDQVRSHEAAMRSHLAAYERLPWYPGERELYESSVLPALPKLEEATARVEAAGAGSARERTEVDLGFDLAAGVVDEALSAVVDLNQSWAFSSTEKILNARRHYDRLTLLLTLGSALVAAVAAAAVMRVLRRDERVSQEALLHQAARAAELEMFASRVCHDLLSPLAGVTLSLGGIARRHADPRTREAVARAERTLERSRAMVQGMYEFARAGARPADDARTALRVGVQGAIDDLAAPGWDPPTEVIVEPMPDVEVACSAGVLSAIVSNLLCNAAKCMRESPVRRITVRALLGGRRARVEVEDTGPGVPPALEASIFEPYVRAPGSTQEGMGLGLATVKRLVESHRGAVGVRRAAQGGAVFHFELPLAPAKADAAAACPAGLRGRVPTPS